MLQINVANLPCEETTVSCRIVQTAVSDVAGMSMCHGTWHGMADVSSHLVTVLACSVSEGCICRLLSTQPEIRLFEDYSPARSSCGSWRLRPVTG